MTPEGKVKVKVKKILKELGITKYFMPMTGGYGVSGMPDFVFPCKLLGGKFVGIETKAKGCIVTALQADALREIDNAGGLAIVVDESNVDLLKYYLLGELQRPKWTQKE